MVKAFLMLADSAIEPKATKGTIVYDFIQHDYGLANDDTRMTGVKHVSVTLDKHGVGQSFTVPETALKAI